MFRACLIWWQQMKIRRILKGLRIPVLLLAIVGMLASCQKDDCAWLLYDCVFYPMPELSTCFGCPHQFFEVVKECPWDTYHSDLGFLYNLGMDAGEEDMMDWIVSFENQHWDIVDLDYESESLRLGEYLYGVSIMKSTGLVIDFKQDSLNPRIYRGYDGPCLCTITVSGD